MASFHSFPFFLQDKYLRLSNTVYNRDTPNNNLHPPLYPQQPLILSVLIYNVRNSRAEPRNVRHFPRLLTDPAHSPQLWNLLHWAIFIFFPLYFTIVTLCWPKLHNRGILDVLNLGVLNHRTWSSRTQSWQLLGWGKLHRALWCLWFQVCCCSGQYKGRHCVKDSQGSTQIFQNLSVMFTVPKDLCFWKKKLTAS